MQANTKENNTLQTFMKKDESLKSELRTNEFCVSLKSGSGTKPGGGE